MIKEGSKTIDYLTTKALSFHMEAYQEKVVVLFDATLHKIQNLV